MAIKPRTRYMLYIIIGFVLFFLVTSFLGFYVSVKPPRILSNTTPAQLGLEFESISFETEDGLTLKGWFIPNQAKLASTIILLHGYPADKGDILPSMAFLAQDYNLLLFDFRRLGESQGKYSTIGARETRDLNAAINYLKSRDISEVGIWGFSLGGAVALMTAPDTPEIRAIVTDSSFARLDKLVPTLYRYPVLNHPLAWLTSLWAKLFVNIDVSEVAPAESVRNLNIPILIIHSKQDKVIPFDHALELQKALEPNPKAEFWFQDNLPHGVHGLEYQERIKDFFKRSL